MTEEERFLHGISEAPFDGALPLVYADCLEERGDPRAEFIRVQRRLLALPACTSRSAPGAIEEFTHLQMRKLALKAVFDRAWLLLVGEPVSGVVVEVTEEVVTVTIGHLTGYAHIEDMSWARKPHLPFDFPVGDEICVRLIGAHPESNRLYLGLLGARKPDSWDRVDSLYVAGSKHRAEVVYSDGPSGDAYLALEPGVGGHVYSNDLRSAQTSDHPGNLLAGGDIVEVEVLAIDREAYQLILGMLSRVEVLGG